LAVICRDIGISRNTVNKWRDEDPGIAAQFDEARDDGYDIIAQDCLSIADDGHRDYFEDADGRPVVDHDHIQRSKLRVETRLKLLAKWDPRRYGDKQQVELSGGLDIKKIERVIVDPANPNAKGVRTAS
jgi:hypothetical protein